MVTADVMSEEISICVCRMQMLLMDIKQLGLCMLSKSDLSQNLKAYRLN